MTPTHRTPRHAVDRPALRARLDAGIAAPLTLIVAPAGSGKTVLLSQWASARPDLTIAWVDVSATDADPLVFAERLVDSLARVGVSLGPLDVPVGTADRGLGAPFVDAFLAELDNVKPIVVIFDDLHNLAGSAIASDLWEMVERLPDSTRFIFASRVDLNLAWRRHRLTHGLVEVRQSDLAFDTDLTTRALEKIVGEKVPLATADAIAAHTEGWAAGVQLSALSIRFATHPEKLTDQLADTDRIITEYLTEEVFDAQTSERQRALLDLSVLDEMSAGLVEEVTQLPDGRAVLADLERESLFIVPVPERVGWYRFHNVFRDLLRYRLRAAEPTRERDLLIRAAQWSADTGDTSTAVEYLLRARAWARVCAVLLASTREDYEKLRTTTIARWLSLVPREARLTDPRAEVLYGIVSGMSGRGARCIEIMRGLLADGVLDDGGRQVALTYIAACVYHQPHPDNFVAAARRSLAHLEAHPDATPPDLLGLTARPILEVVTYASLSRAQFLLGDLDAARTAAETALADCDYGPYRVHISGTLALIEAWAGRLHRASALAEGALDLARELGLLAHPSPADAHLARAIVSIQRGEAEIGAHSLHEGGIRAAVNQRTQLMWVAHAASSLIDPQGTDPSAIEPHGSPPPIVARAMTALQWRSDRLSGAPRSVPPQREPVWSTLAFEHVAAHLEHRAIGEARAVITEARFRRDAQRPAEAVEHDLAWAWLEAAAGHTLASRDHLQRALHLAEGEGLAYPILAAGPAVVKLVDALPGPPTAFRRAIVRSAKPLAGNEPVSPLTSRERELLQYLPTHMNNIDIAAKCYISVNTVKTHMAHLYRKLGVSDRRAAVERARELGLVR